jgi:prepilin-type N-terminal cleavage/methylation domain-containing protein
MKLRANMNPTRGFSLIEAAIALAVLGLIALAAAAYWRSAMQVKVVSVERDLVARAQSAVLGFAYTKFRLPCPASDPATGLEDCTTGNQAQFLPWATLALPDSRARQMRYGVYRKTNANPRLDTDLSAAIATDRAAVLLTTSVTESTTPIGMSTLIGNRNLFDFCHALNTAASQAPDSAYLHTVDMTGQKKNVAFALAMPGLLDADGDGNIFDGAQALQTSANPAFDAPSRPQALDFDDKVVVTSAGTLFATLSCGLAFAAADHTHFNAASTARIMQKGYYDYKFILGLNVAIATVASLGAAASVLSAGAGLAAATATLAAALADAVTYSGATVAAVAAAAIALAAASINVGAAIVGAAAAAAAVTAAGIFFTRFKDERVGVMENLAVSVEGNAKFADALGF